MCRILGDIAGAGDQNFFARQIHISGFEHFLGKVNTAVSGGFGADLAAAPVDALAGQHAVAGVDDPLILSVKIADLSGTDPDVSGRHINRCTDMAVEFTHEFLAEIHHFPFTFALGVKVGTALGAAHGQGGKTVFKNLLKPEKLQDAQVDRRVKTQAALVRSDRAVELDPEPGVDLDFSPVIYPRNLKNNNAFGHDQPFQNTVFFVLVLAVKQFGKRAEDFGNALHKLFLM